MSIENIPPLLTAEQVAEILAISIGTLRKNVSVSPESIPPFLKLGNAKNSAVRWRKSDIDTWIQAQFDANNSTDDFQLLLKKVEVNMGP